jgi:hypothetical protein
MSFLDCRNAGTQTKLARAFDRVRLLLILQFAACALPATVASADVITYTVDPTRSSLTISGTNNGDPLQPQSAVASSLTTSFAGIISASRDSNTLEITSATAIAQNAGAFSIGDESQANYSFLAPSSTNLDLVYWGAIIDFSISMTSPAIGSPTNFDASLVSATIGSGTLEYGRFSVGEPRSELNIGSITSMSGALTLGHGIATLRDNGGIETLTLPIESDLTDELPGPVGTTNLLTIHLSGTIVATASVPEPTSLAVLVVPPFILLFRQRYKKREIERRQL